VKAEVLSGLTKLKITVPVATIKIKVSVPVWNDEIEKEKGGRNEAQ